VKNKIYRRDVTTLIVASIGLFALGCEKREPAGEGVGKAPAAAQPVAQQGTPGVTADTIKVGSWGPLSGPAAQWGTVLKGMEAYFKHINASGGIHGRKVEFIYRDDQYNPSKTPAVVRELVEKENVFAIVGGIGTANGRAVADYLEEKGVPLFTPASGDRFWSEGGKKNVYTVFPKYVSEGEVLGDYVGGTLKAKKVGVLYQDDDFGKQGLEGVKKGVAKHKGTEIVVEVTTQPTDTDLGGQVSQIVEKKPDVLIVYSAPKQGIAAVKMLDAQKKKPQIVTSFVLSDPILFKLAGASWEGTITSAASSLADADEPGVNKYKEILAKYGGDKLMAGTFTMSGFSFAAPFCEAVQRAGKDLTREKFYQALNTFQGWNDGGPHWNSTALGPPISFSADKRLGNDKIYLAKAKGGKWHKLTGWLSASGPAPVEEKAEAQAQGDTKPVAAEKKPAAAE
jgi:ABC-type branched-subunit amino acid transport system substrate-binding protein